MYSPYNYSLVGVVRLQIATLALSAMAAGDASQTTPVQITHVFSCVIYIN